MRFFIVPMLTMTLFMVPDASAFFGCIARATGGMGNINSGTCGGATGLWDSYCSGGDCQPSTSCCYGSGFGAYAHQVPQSRSCHRGCGHGCHQGSGWWYGGGTGAGCGLHGGCSLGSHLRGLLSRLHCRCQSAGASWVGGGLLDSYSVAPASGFSGGIDYGYINSCSDGGCVGGCSDGGNAAGDVIYHSEAAPMQGVPTQGAVMDQPTPALGGQSLPAEGAVTEGPFTHGS